jgi:ABC-type enterochelin transport system permease subunit
MSVTVTYEPFQEIVIMEKTRFNSPEEIARFTSVIAGGKLAGLYWVDGVVFLYFPLTASTAIVAKELLEKHKVYWTFVGYAIMPKYMQIIETKEKMIVPVVEITSDQTLKSVANWLKAQKE